MKRFLFFGLLSLFVFSSCEKEDESDLLYNKLEVVYTNPRNGDVVDAYLFNDVYVIFNYEITYKKTLDRLSRSIRVYNKTTNSDITDKIYITHHLEHDAYRVNIKQLFTFLPNCDYEVEIYLPRGTYTFHFHT